MDGSEFKPARRGRGGGRFPQNYWKGPEGQEHARLVVAEMVGELGLDGVAPYLEGMSFRGVGKVLSVHYLSVINWVNAAERALPKEVADKGDAHTVETDELFTFIGQKKNKST